MSRCTKSDNDHFCAQIKSLLYFVLHFMFPVRDFPLADEKSCLDLARKGLVTEGFILAYFHKKFIITVLWLYLWNQFLLKSESALLIKASIMWLNLMEVAWCI